MAERPATTRCAVYTRKSSEEGLEQDFNSLHAQREACEAYILSQRHEGWVMLPEAYDDGGISGGTMERPALQRLLADITQRRVDTVVVYKVDRLTRSLADFARIIETFDRHQVSFVSVTQAFNTTSSMGRLTLNVLLSFAQFEREVTGERIRDKIAASKKKGLWMGGSVPTGYQPNGRTLQIVESEADAIRTIYRLYLDLPSVDDLKEELDRRGMRTRERVGQDGKVTGGGLYSRGQLYKLLENPLYIGRITHKGAVYDGQQPAIVDGALWDAVQAKLAANAHRRLVRAHSPNPSLLAGLLFDAAGEKLIATHANKKGVRYRYYITPSKLRFRQGRPSAEAVAERDRQQWRLPASEIEGAVVRALVAHLGDRAWLLDQVAVPAGRVEEFPQLVARGQSICRVLETGGEHDRCGMLVALLDRVEIRVDQIALTLKAGYLFADSVDAKQLDQAICINLPMVQRRRGSELRLVIDGATRSAPEPDPVLIRAIAEAHRWWRDLESHRFPTIAAIASAYGRHESDVRRVLPLAFLEPALLTAILNGTQPTEMTLKELLKPSAKVRIGHPLVSDLRALA